MGGLLFKVSVLVSKVGAGTLLNKPRKLFLSPIIDCYQKNNIIQFTAVNFDIL